jgi:hypothetical protein
MKLNMTHSEAFVQLDGDRRINRGCQRSCSNLHRVRSVEVDDARLSIEVVKGRGAGDAANTPITIFRTST